QESGVPALPPGSEDSTRGSSPQESGEPASAILPLSLGIEPRVESSEPGASWQPDSAARQASSTAQEQRESPEECLLRAWSSFRAAPRAIGTPPCSPAPLLSGMVRGGQGPGSRGLAVPGRSPAVVPGPRT